MEAGTKKKIWWIGGIIALLAISGALYYFLVYVPGKILKKYAALTHSQQVAFASYANHKYNLNLLTSDMDNNTRPMKKAVVKYFDEFLGQATGIQEYLKTKGF